MIPFVLALLVTHSVWLTLTTLVLTYRVKRLQDALTHTLAALAAYLSEKKQ